MFPCAPSLKMDVLSLSLPGMGMCYWASPWTSRDCGLTACCQSRSSCRDSFNCRGRPTAPGFFWLFWAFPGVFHGKGLSEPGVPSISAGNHLQNLGSRQKGVAGVTLLGCLWCLLQVWPWRTHCDIRGCSWYAFSPTQPFLIQTN